MMQSIRIGYKRAFTFLLPLFVTFSLFSQQSIEEIRLLPVGSVVTTTGTITSGPEYGQLRYMQDDQAGIAAYGGLLASYLSGDSIVITGVLSKYRGELQLSPVMSAVFIASNRQIKTLSLDNLEDSSDSEFESRKVIFTCMGIASCEPLLSEGWYTVYDQQGNIARLSITNGQDVEGYPISDSPFTVEGIWTRFEDQYQLKCQYISDASEGTCHFISPPQLSFSGNVPHLVWDKVGPEGSEVWINDGNQNFIMSFGPTNSFIEAAPDFLEPGILYNARLTQLDST
ncbi:MAG: hypothetical protein KBA14_08405, partial [Saprospiraceae bacterium]|nr:hypothetical protein [Saprospiraceae bacterium]